MAKVYIKTDIKNRIIEINSDVFLKKVSEYILIDEGTGTKYSHAQNYYLKDTLSDDRNIYKYKYVDGKIEKRTEEEMEQDATEINENSTPSLESRVNDLEDILANLVYGG